MALLEFLPTRPVTLHGGDARLPRRSPTGLVGAADRRAPGRSGRACHTPLQLSDAPRAQ